MQRKYKLEGLLGGWVLIISFNTICFRAVFLAFLVCSDGFTFNMLEVASVDWYASWHKRKARPSERLPSRGLDKNKMYPSQMEAPV